MAQLPHTRAEMRALYAVWQVAELAAGYRYTTASVSKVVTSIPTSSATCWGCRRSIFHAQLGMTAIGLTACSGDSWRDTVENTPMLVCVHACGGTDGACHAANDLPGRLSRV